MRSGVKQRGSKILISERIPSFDVGVHPQLRYKRAASVPMSEAVPSFKGDFIYFSVSRNIHIIEVE
jgi:hypothetical protein